MPLILLNSTVMWHLIDSCDLNLSEYLNISNFKIIAKEKLPERLTQFSFLYSNFRLSVLRFNFGKFAYQKMYPLLMCSSSKLYNVVTTYLGLSKVYSGIPNILTIALKD